MIRKNAYQLRYDLLQFTNRYTMLYMHTKTLHDS